MKTGYGPVIKCQKCLYHFHPECARRLKKFFLEINENENGVTTFLAYCNKDTPPKHLKKYELIKQRKKDEIKKFSDLIKKDISSLNKMHEDKQYNLLHPFCYYPNNNEIKKILNNKKNNLSESNNYLNNNDLVYNDSSKKSNINGSDKNIELTSSEKKCLVNAIREILIDESNLTLEINTEDYSIKKNNNIKFTFEDMTYPEKFSWCYLKETQDYLNGISNFETFKIYQSIIPTPLIPGSVEEDIRPQAFDRDYTETRHRHDKFLYSSILNDYNGSNGNSKSGDNKKNNDNLLSKKDLENNIFVLFNLQWLFPHLLELEVDLSDKDIVRDQIKMNNGELLKFSNVIKRAIKQTYYVPDISKVKIYDPFQTSFVGSSSQKYYENFSSDDDSDNFSLQILEDPDDDINNLKNSNINKINNNANIDKDIKKKEEKKEVNNFDDFIIKYKYMLQMIVIYGYFISKMSQLFYTTFSMPFNLEKRNFTTIKIKKNLFIRISIFSFNIKC